jgi:hypothetical protein
MIEAIITDLDGTLLSPDGTISLANKNALKRAMGKGIKVILASGRRYLSAERFAKELDLDEFIIAYSGAWVKKPSQQKPIIEYDMPYEASCQYMSAVQDRVDLCGVYLDDTFFVQQKNDSLERYEARSHLKAVEVGDVCGFLMETKRNPTKIFTLAKPEILEIITGEMRGRFSGVLDFVKSWETYLEVGPVGISKGSSLTLLASRENISLKDCIFFGDHENDISAMEVVGISVAMGNATDEVKKRASLVAPSNSEDGVAKVLERMIG